MKSAGNFVRTNRGMVAVNHHAPIIFKPLVLALAFAYLWWRWLHGHVELPEDATEPIMVVVLPFCFFLYVIFASVAVASVFDRWKTLSGAVVCRDLDTFLQYRDERLPILMHILIGAPSILLAAFVMVLDYGETAWGAAAVFAVVYMLALVWSIAIELDDFHRAIWFQAKVPDHWYEVDVEAHFKLPAPQRIAEARRGS